MDIQTWAKQLIDIYNKSETEDVYDRRNKNESKNIKSVLASIKSQRFSLSPTQKKADIVHLLKAAEVISLNGGNDYLAQFLQIPDVKRVIIEKLQPSMVAKVTQKAMENVKNGTVPNFPKTIAEIDKVNADRYLADSSILTKGNATQEIEHYRRYIKSIGRKGSFELETYAGRLEDISDIENGILSLEKVISRQEGYNPGEIAMEWGVFTFEIDVPEKTDIEKAQKKVPGISYAQAEKLRQEQESREIHQKEMEKLDRDRQQQMDDNNKGYAEAQKKRTAEQQSADEKRRKMFSSPEKFRETVDYKKKASSFAESLKCNPSRNSINNGSTQQNIQHNTQRKSKGMGMGR